MNIEKLVTDYLPLADKLARQESSKFAYSVALDEIKSAAYMGLVDAANKFDPDRNVPFGAYARTRIVGEIRDYIRFLLKTSDCSELDAESCPARSLSDHSVTEDFFEFVCNVLGPSDGKIIHMYYVDDRTLGEIGLSKGVSESRISQIIKKIHRRLKCVLS